MRHFTPQPKQELEIPVQADTMYPHENEILNDRTQFEVVVAHRRGRKTTTLINKVLLEAISGGKGMYFIVYPTATQARDILWRDRNQLWRLIPKELIKTVREVEMNIELINGAVICIRGSDDSDRLVGTSGKFYALDEYSIMNPDVFNRIVYPVVKAGGGGCYISGTPRGKNDFHKLFLRGNDPNYPEWKSFYYPINKTQVFSQQEIDTLRFEMTQDLFASEYECQWLEGSGVVFRNVKEACTLNPRRPRDGEMCVMGVDLARLQDYTAISVFSYETNEMLYLEQFKDLDWTFQAKKIKAIYERFNQPLIVIETNNIGDAVIDTLQRMGLAAEDGDIRKLEGFTTTAPSKKLLIEKASLYLEGGKVKLLNDPTLINQFESFGYKLTPSGNVQYEATHGGHDDIVMSCMLAIQKLFPVNKVVPTRELTPMEENYERVKWKHAMELRDDLDMFQFMQGENW